MENFVRNTKLNIEEEIKRIEQQPIETLDKIKKIIDVIQVSLALLKRPLSDINFKILKKRFFSLRSGNRRFPGC